MGEGWMGVWGGFEGFGVWVWGLGFEVWGLMTPYCSHLTPRTPHPAPQTLLPFIPSPFTSYFVERVLYSIDLQFST
jgi:hypothetical protein